MLGALEGHGFQALTLAFPNGCNHRGRHIVTFVAIAHANVLSDRGERHGLQKGVVVVVVRRG